jgi:hypothetical protein
MNNCAHFRHLAHFLLELEMFHTKVVGKNGTHFMFSFFSEKVPFLSVNLQQNGTARQAVDPSIIRRMRIACWNTKAANTRPEYLVLTTFPRKQWLRERAPF